MNEYKKMKEGKSEGQETDIANKKNRSRFNVFES